MDLNTIWQLSCGDGMVVNIDDKIKLCLRNGEILIGEYQSSDYTSLSLNRVNEELDIDFEDIENIEVIKE